MFQFLFSWGTLGSNPGQFNGPASVSINPVTDNVYVTDNLNHRVQEFSSSGVFITQWGSFGSAPGQFSYPAGIAVNPTTGNVYVSDKNNYRIQEFSSSGVFITQWGSYGPGMGFFTRPYGMAINPATGNVYVSDLYNALIQEFSSSGVFITQWGSAGSGNGQFIVPTGVAIDSTTGNVYVSDPYNNRVQEFSSTGSYINQFGTAGSANGQFNGPNGMAVDTSGNVYVVDGANARIQVFGLVTITVATDMTHGNFIIPGQSVTFIATVSPSISTGTVQFQVNGTNYGNPVTLAAGQATLTTSSLVSGTYDITALYSSVPSYAPSTSNSVILTVLGPTQGRVTGGGHIGSSIELGFEVHSNTNNDDNHDKGQSNDAHNLLGGNLEYHDKSAKIFFDSDSIIFLSVNQAMTSATFAGTGDIGNTKDNHAENHGIYSFVVSVTDPDKTRTHDTFSIIISDSTGKVVYANSGTVQGHIEIHALDEKDNNLEQKDKG
jgi:DNA-binding beta-propeller fold protein YncE